MEKIKFVSIWDGGFEVTSNAELNTKTGEVLNIGENDISEREENELEVLDGQKIIYNGKEYEVLEDKNGMEYSVDL